MPKIHLLISFICAKNKNKNHLLAVPFNSREKRERKEECTPILFILLFSLFCFWALKSPHPTLFKSELLAPGFLKMLVRLDCV
jgi:hypothetical protein